MTRDLRRSNENLEEANINLVQRRKYMETVLRNVSAGVISVNVAGFITTINRAAKDCSKSNWKGFNKRLKKFC
jgi:two-component system nitrogen regulation sensor histidine kinase NtrY